MTFPAAVLLGQQRFSSFMIQRDTTAAVGYLIVGSPIERPAGFRLVHTTPLFEKE